MLPESGPPKCLSFGNIDECDEWLLRRQEEKKVQNLSSEPMCVVKGMGPCTALPHRHRLRHKHQRTGSTIRTVACDNHVSAYTSTGWFEEPTMVCSACCTNEPMDGDGICENCARENGLLTEADLKTDAIRIKEQGYCINRQLVHGCLFYTSDPAENMCAFCQNFLKKTSILQTEENLVGAHKQLHGTRVRTIPTSTRPCALTPSCAGNMTGTVRKFYSSEKPQLWWTCGVCKASAIAKTTTAVPAPMHGGAED